MLVTAFEDPNPPRAPGLPSWPTVLPPGQEKTEAPDEHREPFLAGPGWSLKTPSFTVGEGGTGGGVGETLEEQVYMVTVGKEALVACRGRGP